MTQENLASKTDIADFLNKTDFDDKLNKLNKLNKKVTSNKTKRVLVKNKLDELLKKVKEISTKRLRNNLINEYSVLNDAKYFSEILQNYFITISAKKYIKYFSGTTRIYSWKSKRM